MKTTFIKSLLLLALVVFISSCGQDGTTETKEEVIEKPVVEQKIDITEDNEAKEKKETEIDIIEEEVNNDETEKEDDSEGQEEIEETNEENLPIVEEEEEKVEARVITIEAKKWEYTPSVIKVKQGENVVIEVINTDTLHGIGIPDMKVQGNDEVTVDTSKKGTFEFRCVSYCGEGHQDMVGTIIVE